jgi:glycosyltransferase involved in cell wall biosynthesis
VYTDAVLRRTDHGVFAGETFVVFVTGLRDHVERLVLVGRVAPDGEADHYRLRDDVEVVGLPHYASLAEPAAVLRSAVASLRAFWRVLDEVDVAWLFGPHPLALAFGLAALARRRRVVLGVRQDMPAHMRARHPTRRWLWAAAVLLEGAWRALARRCPTVVVGPDLARRYRHARRLLPIVVSTIEEPDAPVPDDAPVPAAPVTVGSAGDGRPRVLLSVGRLDPEKNPLMLVDVLSRLRAGDDRWRLVVCGEGSLAGELADGLVAAGAGEAADLLGFVALPDLRQRYRQADVLAHVSWTEGVPQVVLEAFAAGLPVVATDVGGVAEACGDAALLVPPGDPGAMVDAVRRVAGDEALRDVLVRRGRDVARRHTGAAERGRVAAFLDGRAPVTAADAGGPRS